MTVGDLTGYRGCPAGEGRLVDARTRGYAVDDAGVDLSPQDINRVGDTSHARSDTDAACMAHQGVRGTCNSATRREVNADRALAPALYVGAAESDGESIEFELQRPALHLLVAFDESRGLEALVGEQLGRLS